MVSVIFNVLRKDEDVVQIHKDEFMKEVSQNVINEVLENSMSVTQTEGHYKLLKMSNMSFKACFPFIFYVDQIVGFAEVKFRKDGGFGDRFQS